MLKCKCFKCASELSVHKILEKSEFNIYLKNLRFQAEHFVFQPDAYTLHT